jgi:hypothetical protein
MQVIRLRARYRWPSLSTRMIRLSINPVWSGMTGPEAARRALIDAAG